MESLVAVSARRAVGNPTKPRGRRTKLRRAGVGAVMLGALSSAAPAWACPRCAAGIAARSELWNKGLVFNVLSALAPFLVVGAVSLWFERTARP